MTDPLESLTDRELDARFAEVVLGFEVRRSDLVIMSAWEREHGKPSDIGPYWYMYHPEGRGHILAEGGAIVLPAYTRSLDAALEAMPFIFDLGLFHLFASGEKEWVAIVGVNKTGHTDHPARAIVLACLKAVSK